MKKLNSIKKCKTMFKKSLLPLEQIIMIDQSKTVNSRKMEDYFLKSHHHLGRNHYDWPIRNSTTHHLYYPFVFIYLSWAISITGLKLSLTTYEWRLCSTFIQTRVCTCHFYCCRWKRCCTFQKHVRAQIYLPGTTTTTTTTTTTFAFCRWS
jgi:hypothetical protein